jgi:hypothetical protein
MELHMVENGTAEAARSGSALSEILDMVNNVAMQVNRLHGGGRTDRHHL